MFFKFFFLKKKVREKRAYPRKRSRNLMSLGADRPRLSNLVNISQGGLQFTSLERLEKNQILKMKVNLAEENTHVEILGRVVWIRDFCRKHRCNYRVGIAFLNLDYYLTAIIRNYVFSPARI